MARGKGFKFSVAELEREFRTAISKQSTTHAEEGKAQQPTTDLVENLVRDNLDKMFPCGDLAKDRVMYRHCIFSGGGDRGRTEFDFVVSEKPLPVPRNELNFTFPHLPGGPYLIGEVLTHDKSMVDLVRKFQSLGPNHRPIHTLMSIGCLLIIFGGFISCKGAPIQKTAEGIFVQTLFNTDSVYWDDFRVLLAAGRVHYFSLDSLPELLVVAKTRSDFVQENQFLRSEIAKRDARIAALQSERAALNLKVAEAASTIASVLERLSP